MRLIDELKAEHQLIEQVVGSLRTFATRRAMGTGHPADAADYLCFFEVFAGDYHHQREEQALLAGLVREAGLPASRGPIAEVVRQHQAMAVTRSALTLLLGATVWSAVERDHVLELTRQFCDALLKHIDLENSVLFPEGQSRLMRSGVAELDARSPSVAELRARALGEALCRRYPPTENHQLMRGDGCVLCTAYNETCDGLEREWWSDAEWDHFTGAGDFE